MVLESRAESNLRGRYRRPILTRSAKMSQVLVEQTASASDTSLLSSYRHSQDACAHLLSLGGAVTPLE